MKDKRQLNGNMPADNIIKMFGHVGHIEENFQKPKKEPEKFKVSCPIINNEATKLMMSGFRIMVAEYNDEKKKANIEVLNYNQVVKFHLSEKASNIQVESARNFKKRHRDLDAEEYNTEAERINAIHGPIIEKKKYHIIKYQTEQFFQNFLYVYNHQLTHHNEPYWKFGIREPRPLPPLKVNSNSIACLRRPEEGTRSLNVCNRTVRNHRKHLEAAGILINSEYRGFKRAVQVEINPRILVVYDDHTKKLMRPDIQFFMESERKTFTEFKDTTSPFKVKYKEKNAGEPSLVEKVSPEATNPEHYKGIFYKTTGSKVQNSPGGAPAEKVVRKKSPAEELRDQLLHPQELAEQLAAGKFDNYIPVPLQLLNQIAYGTPISGDDFREFVIQECMKLSAKMYIGSTPFAGSWKKAINLWMKYKFLNFKDAPLPPTNLVAYVEEYRWRLEHARRWFNRPTVKVKPLYPSDYFDPTRKTTQEIGFEGTLKMWQRHCKTMEKRKAEKLMLDKKAAQRQKRMADNTKYNREIGRFLKGRTGLTQLIDYVRNNLPEEFYRELPTELQRRMEPHRYAAEVRKLKANNP